jgi:hypothetical protein
MVTPMLHEEFPDIDQAASQFKRLSKRRAAQLHYNESDLKIIQVQEKFPNDQLHLDEVFDDECLRSLRNGSNSKNTTKSKSTEEERSLQQKNEDSGEKEDDELDAEPPPVEFTPSLVTKRLYIQEGPAKMSSGLSTNERYMFLFNDLLLIAESKSASTFKLKHRVRVSEMWLANCVDEVTETSVSLERSFVVGWPTCNYVATFNSVEEKELWYSAFQKYICERRQSDESKTVSIKVSLKVLDEPTTHGTTINKQLTAGSTEDTRTVVKNSLEQFQILSDDAHEYQLWVFSEKDGTYPLIGKSLHS